jgi:hypothetical protein
MRRVRIPKRLMYIELYSLDRRRRFRRESTAISTLSPKGDMTMDLDLETLPARIVRHRGRSLPEPSRTAHARLWGASGTDERLRAPLPGSGGTVV